MTETVKQTHPVRGVLWGLMFGIGLALVLVITKVITLDLTTMIIVVVVGTIAGTAWSILGPAKAPKGPPPAEPITVERAEPSRFDDFESPAEAVEHAQHHDDAVKVDDTPTDTGDDD